MARLTARVLLRGNVVDRLGVVDVLLKETLGVVDGDGPEAIHRHLARHIHLEDGFAVVLLGRDAGIARILIRIGATPGGSDDQMLDRIDMAARSHRVIESAAEFSEHQQRTDFLLLLKNDGFLM